MIGAEKNKPHKAGQDRQASIMDQIMNDNVVGIDAADELVPVASKRRRKQRPVVPDIPTAGVVVTSVKGTTDRQKTVDPRNALNELTSTEWMPETVSVWNQRGLGANHPDAQIERQHPAPFSFTDISRVVRFFTKRGELVLDPFVGVGSTLKACAVEGRRGIGFELNPRYAELARERLRVEEIGRAHV